MATIHKTDNARAYQFAAYVAARDLLESQAKAAAKALAAIPGIGSGTMGLTPDSVKQSREYREAKALYSSAHEALRKLNAGNVKRFALELRREREAARAARMAALAQVESR